MENVQHDAAATTTTEAALLDDDSERKRAEQEEKEVQTSSPTEAAENKNQGSRIESSPEGVENVQDRAHMQTPPPESQLSSANTTGTKIEDLGWPVTFEVTVYHGEDVVAKLLEIWTTSKYPSCIISASGHISEAKFRKPNSNVHDIYQGDFAIVSLSGNCLHQRNNSVYVWWLSVALAGYDDRSAFGGSSTSLIAHEDVSILMMTFVKVKEKSTENEENCDETGTSTAAEIIAKATLEDIVEKKKNKKKKKKNKKKKN